MSLFEDPTIARVTALILKVLEKGPASTAQLWDCENAGTISRRWRVRVLSAVQ